MKKNTTPRRWISLAIIAMLFFSPAFLQGCDSMMGTNNPDTIIDLASQPSKMRHTQLFGTGSDGSAGKVLDRYSELATSTEFVLGFSTTVLDAQKILDRYSLEPGVEVKRLLQNSINGFAMHIDADKLDHLLNIIELDDDIAWMEPDPEFTFVPSGNTWAMDMGQRLVGGITNIQGHRTSANPGDGQGAVDMDIYILDTGIDHPDVNVVERVDFTAAGQDIDMTKILDRYSDTMDAFSDGVGHGTHVAGIVGAIDDADHLVGMAPGARLHDFKVLNDQGRGEMSGVIAALDVVTARKNLNPSTPMIVNLSLGADIGTTAYNALDQAVVEAINRGVVVVIAAGNLGIDVSTVTPAHVVEAITVGATTNEDQNSTTIAAFSNTGDGVDIYATGAEVRSLAPGDLNNKIEMSGTSMAAPMVTGAAALILSQDSGASPADVRNALVGNSDTIKIGKGRSATSFKLLNAQNF